MLVQAYGRNAALPRCLMLSSSRVPGSGHLLRLAGSMSTISINITTPATVCLYVGAAGRLPTCCCTECLSECAALALFCRAASVYK